MHTQTQSVQFLYRKYRILTNELNSKKMKTKKRIMLTGLACGLYVSGLLAGGLLTNTNQSVHFLRNPARTASFEIDAVYTNPAGLAKLSNGLHFSLNNQSAFQTRTITSTFPLFAANGGSETKSFEGEATAPVIPSLMGAYKNGKWVASFYVGVIGGGGTLTFDKGLPSFEIPISMLPSQLSASGVPTTQYSVDAYFKGSSMIIGGQLGVTYALSDVFSVYAGARINMASNSYVGHLRNISINPAHPALNPSGNMMLANTFFSNAQQAAILAQQAAQGASDLLQLAIIAGAGQFTLNQMVAAGNLTQAQVDQLAGGLGLSPQELGVISVNQVQEAFNNAVIIAGTAAATYGSSAAQTADKNLDNKQSGKGITPIIGFNLNFDKLNIGAKYEFRTNMNIENKTEVDDTGLFPDGAKTPYDMPALFTLGAQYEVIPGVSVSAGFHHFFDSDAKMQNDKQKHINGGINEFLLGAEWKINKLFLVSAGGQMTRTGATDDFQSDMSYSLNSYSIGFGGAINVSKSVRINLAYFFTNYEDWTKTPFNVSSSIPMASGKDIFARTNKAFGIGLDFRF